MTHPMSDADGMAATEAGSRAARAVDELYRRHVGEVYRYAYAMLGNRADAEDVAQTTFMNALRALERGERPRKPSSWLLAIAHNIVRQRFRQAQTRPTEVELDRELAGVEQEDGGGGPTVDEMLKALARIPPGQREAIVMREFEGRPYAEIAETLGITTSALETLLFRARRSLADELENVVTCEQAELAISRRLDERLSRKERRRLEQHLSECANCARFEQVQRRGRRAFRGLALLPLPASLTFFKGTYAAEAAASLPTIGAATAGMGASGAGAAAGGLAAGGLAVKAAAVVAAVGVAGGVGYTGVQEVRDDGLPPPRAPTHAESKPTQDAATQASKLARGKAEGRTKGNGKATAPAKALGNTRAAQGNATKQARTDRTVREKPERAEPRGERAVRGSARTSKATTMRGKTALAPGKRPKATHSQRTTPRQDATGSRRKDVASASDTPTTAKTPLGPTKPEQHAAPARRATPGPALAPGKAKNARAGKPQEAGGGKKD